MQCLARSKAASMPTELLRYLPLSRLWSAGTSAGAVLRRLAGGSLTGSGSGCGWQGCGGGQLAMLVRSTMS